MVNTTDAFRVLSMSSAGSELWSGALVAIIMGASTGRGTRWGRLGLFELG